MSNKVLVVANMYAEVVDIVSEYSLYDWKFIHSEYQLKGVEGLEYIIHPEYVGIDLLPTLEERRCVPFEQ